MAVITHFREGGSVARADPIPDADLALHPLTPFAAFRWSSQAATSLTSLRAARHTPR